MIICTDPYGRLHVGNKYIMVFFHHFCGPTFYSDRNMTELYDPVDENDPVWEAFAKWYDKRLVGTRKDLVGKIKAEDNSTNQEIVLL